jgi:hypothetical protein
MIDGFSAHFAHATPVQHYDMPLPQIMRNENLP